MGKLDASIAGDVEHAYVPNLAAKGAGYTFSDASGVAQRLLGNFGCGREEQEVAVIDALKVGAIGTLHRPDTGFRFLFLPSLSPPPQLVSGWSAVDQSINLQVASVYCQLVSGEHALEMCRKLALA